jgi:hypothetical protein
LNHPQKSLRLTNNLHHKSVTGILEDDLSGKTGDPGDDFLYTADFYKEEVGEPDFRHEDLEPV